MANASEYTGQIEYFFNQVISTPAGALPKGAQWIVVFDGFPSVIGSVADFEPSFAGGKWDIQKALAKAQIPAYQSTIGCVFAQAINVIGDGFMSENVGIKNSGLIGSFVGKQRNEFGNLTIEFLDTNTSFVENLIRPWAIVTSHLGMIAYPPNDPSNYRTNITLYKLGITAPDVPPFIRQKVGYFGACPITVDSESYDYNTVSAPHKRTATFAYHYYNIDSSGDVNA